MTTETTRTLEERMDEMVRRCPHQMVGACGECWRALVRAEMEAAEERIRAERRECYELGGVPCPGRASPDEGRAPGKPCACGQFVVMPGVRMLNAGRHRSVLHTAEACRVQPDKLEGMAAQFITDDLLYAGAALRSPPAPSEETRERLGLEPCVCTHDAGSHAKCKDNCCANNAGVRCHCKSYSAAPPPEDSGAREATTSPGTCRIRVSAEGDCEHLRFGAAGPYCALGAENAASRDRCTGWFNVAPASLKEGGR